MKLFSHLYLTGFMGAGKSTVGKALALRWKVPFLDLDELLEKKENRRIAQIFAEKGEAYFRAQERKVLKEVAAGPFAVVATGGGVVLQRRNRELMKKTGIVVFLDASLETIKKRLKGETGNRPLFRRKGVKELYCSRLPFYLDCHLVIDTNDLGVKEIGEAIEAYVSGFNL